MLFPFGRCFPLREKMTSTDRGSFGIGSPEKSFSPGRQDTKDPRRDATRGRILPGILVLRSVSPPVNNELFLWRPTESACRVKLLHHKERGGGKRTIGLRTQSRELKMSGRFLPLPSHAAPSHT